MVPEFSPVFLIITIEFIFSPCLSKATNKSNMLQQAKYILHKTSVLCVAFTLPISAGPDPTQTPENTFPQKS